MAYVSTVEGGHGLGASVIANDSPHHAVTIPDAELLFTGTFHRAGPDLILTGHDGRHHIVPGYFSSEHHAALVAPNGASLAADVVDLLAGSPTPGQYVQAQPAPPPDAIGRVEKVVGDVTVMRNGAAVTLHVGDAVQKSDVVQTGDSSAVGITFPDGTALNLVANTRMALNDYSYDPNGNSNSALMTLVQGTFAFVAGKVAHTGDMKIATPVATMGIRGTTGVVEQDAPTTVTANLGTLAYSFAVVPDFGTSSNGAYTLCYTDPATGACQVFTTVSQAGYLVHVTPLGADQAPAVAIEALTASQAQFEESITRDLFALLTPLTQPPGTSGSSTPPPFSPLNTNPQQYENNGQPLEIFAPPLGGPQGSGPAVQFNPGPAPGPTPIVYWIGGNGNWDAAGDWSDGIVPWSISVVEILNPVTVTLSDGQSADGLVLGAGATLDIVSGGSLEIFNSISGGGTVELNSSGSDPALLVDGTVTLKGGGTILMTGMTCDDNIVGVDGSDAKLINVDYTITGTGMIGHDGDGELTFVNEGTVNATGTIVVDTGNLVCNTATGLMEATAGGTLQIDDDLANCGMVVACGAGSTVMLCDDSVDNTGTVVARCDGAVTLDSVFLTNQAGAIFEATDGGSIAYDTGNLTNDGSVLADCGGTIAFQGSLEIINNAGATFEATDYGSITLDGADGLSLINDSTILAQDHGTITFDEVAVTNDDGIIAAEAAGTVIIETDGGPGVFGGLIEALGAGSTVQLEAASLNDLTLTTSGGGAIETTSGTSTFLDVTLDGADVKVEADTVLDLQGITTIEGTVTLEGGGTVQLDYTSYQIIAGSSDPTLDVDTTIEGAATIGTGDNSLTLNIGADGTIDATGQLNIETGENVVDNLGLLEATAGGSLELYSSVDNSGGGKISASGAGSAVDLFGVTVTGGTLQTTDGGLIQTAAHSGNSTFDGVTIAAGSQVDVNDGTSLTLQGDIDNEGTITVEAGADPALVIDGAVTLSGGGTVVLGGTNDSIVGTGTGTNTLDNQDTITGAGAIGSGLSDFSLDNQGTVNADDAGKTLSINTGANAVTNTGTLEASCGGTLEILSNVANAGGTIAAYGSNSTVQLAAGITISGGTLQTGNRLSASGGMIEILAAGLLITTFDGTAHAVTNDGYVQVDAGADLALAGTIDNHGTIDLASTADPAADLTIVGDVTLQDGGAIVLNGDGAIVSNGSAATLTNVDNTLIGAGTIGDAHLTLVNDSGAAIIANVCGATLTLDTGDNHISNCGLLMATDGGVLVIDSCLDNMGRVTAQQGGQIQIDADVRNDGQIGAQSCGSISFDGVCITNCSDGSVGVETCGAITVADSHFDNYGSVGANSGGVFTFSNSTVDNYGELDGDISNGMQANGGSIVFDCSNVDTTGLIQASNCGSVTFAYSCVDNSGGIVSDGNGIVALNGGLVCFDHCDITNTGVIRASINGDSGTATIAITDSTIHNAGGTIDLVGAGSRAELSDVTICGGTLQTDDAAIGDLGVFEVRASNDGTTLFDGRSSAVTVAAYVQVDAGADLALAGTIDFDNNGTIVLLSGSDPELIINGCVSLSTDTGGGVVLSGADDRIVGGCDGGTLNNGATIAGAGSIGGDGLILVNEAGGVVDADQCGQTLSLDTGHDISSAGLLEATDGGTLAIADDVCNSGLLSASCGGILDVTAHSISWTGGDTANAGSNGIALDHGTLLVDSCALTLDGGGAVALDCGTIAAASWGDALHNADTITGTGTIGCGGLVLTNEACGVIDANQCGGTLTLDTGCNIITNLGTLIAENDGTLDVKSAVDNCGGMLQANSGGLLDVESCISGGCATIMGGTLEFDAASNVNVAFNNGGCGTDYGTLVLGDAAQFCGQICGFAGTAAGSANSDTVELVNFTETSYCVQYCGGNEILTLYDGDQHVTLTFDDFSGCFVVKDVGGNTYIYDPPASGGAAPAPAAAGGPSGDGAHESFAPAVGWTDGFASWLTQNGAVPTGTAAAIISALMHGDGAPLAPLGGSLGSATGDGAHESVGPAGLVGNGAPEPVGPVGVVAALEPATPQAAGTSDGGAAGPASTGWSMNFGSDQFQPLHPATDGTPSAATPGQSNPAGIVSVTLGGSNHDAFVFNALAGHAGPAGPDNVGTHGPSGSAVDHVGSVPPVEAHLIALLATETAPAAGATEAVHVDGIATTAMDQFHQLVASAGHLH